MILYISNYQVVVDIDADIYVQRHTYPHAVRRVFRNKSLIKCG